MSSVLRSVANTERGSQYYINTTTTVVGDRFNANGVALTAGTLNSGSGNERCGIGAVGTILVRDMGKTLRVPINTLSSTVAGTKYRVLRKVQLVDVTSETTAATNNGNSNTDGVSDQTSAATGLLAGGCFYIEFGGLLADGSTTLAVKFARLRIPN